MRTTLYSIALAALLLVSATTAMAHCEIPCGIYGDPARFVEMREHVTTLEKSMQQIVELSGQETVNHNQLVRWVTNKELHAVKLQEVVWQYFLAQRVKPVAEKDDKAGHARYLLQLELLHKIIVHAMKAKQTTDLAQIEALRKLIDRFEKVYFDKS
jgi:nickel superoxide dismutase